MPSQFDRRIFNYCKTHTDDPLAEYFPHNYGEVVDRKKAEAKKWKNIAAGLILIDAARVLHDEEIKT